MDARELVATQRPADPRPGPAAVDELGMGGHAVLLGDLMAQLLGEHPAQLGIDLFVHGRVLPRSESSESTVSRGCGEPPLPSATVTR